MTDSRGIVRTRSYQQIGGVGGGGKESKEGISETASFTAILRSECAPLSLLTAGKSWVTLSKEAEV